MLAAQYGPVAVIWPLRPACAIAIWQAMLNLLSALIGLITLILMIPAVFPLLGALNWILVPMALFGAFIGLMSSKKGGQNFCLIVAGFGALRLFLGGGIL